MFVTCHLLNLSLGLVSIEAMNAARVMTIEPWRTLPGTIILGGALLLHALMALWSLFNRHNLRLKAWETTQINFGFVLPLLMASHVIADAVEQLPQSMIHCRLLAGTFELEVFCHDGSIASLILKL